MEEIVNDSPLPTPEKAPQRGIVSLLIGLALMGCGILVTPLYVERLVQGPAKTQLSHPEFYFLTLLAIALVGVGGTLVVLRRRASGKQLLFSVIPILIFFLLTELGLRTYHATKNALARRYDFSAKAGWTTPENEKWRRPVKGFGFVDFSTKHDGFREYGDVNTTRTKVFFVGDSFTHAYTVSDDKAYFNEVERQLKNVELFVYGCGGYGTLQEYMILDRFYDQVKPDVIILQMGSNDIINNSYELESESFLNNKHMMRPYLRRGRIQYLYPSQDYGLLYNVIEMSHVLQFFDVRMGILKTEISGTIEASLSTSHPLVLQSVKTTDEIFGMIRKRVGDTPVCAFSNDKKFYAGADYVGDHYINLAKKHGFHWIPGIPETIDEALARGWKVTGAPYDVFHWNEQGHKLVGEKIASWLRRQPFTKPLARTPVQPR